MPKKQSQLKQGEIIIYQAKNKKVSLQIKLEQETVWLTQKQIAILFGTQRPAITKHLNNIFKAKELDKNSVSSILEHTASDGKTYKTQLYNLDAIISVGYRINSARATQFRIWATKVLKDHILKGFTINQNRLQQQKQVQLKELENTVRLLQTVIQKKQLSSDEATGLLKVISDYTNSWILLQKYDQGKLKINAGKKTKKTVDYNQALKAIQQLKTTLIKKKEASRIFGIERDRGLESILGNINQSFGNQQIYPSVESKAAHLLYFIIKNHPFVDGNKRIACLLFLLFLSQNNYLYKKGERRFNDNALVAMALLVAESDPRQKDILVKLVINFLS